MSCRSEDRRQRTEDGALRVAPLGDGALRVAPLGDGALRVAPLGDGEWNKWAQR